jgi:hypothetical protein
MKNEDVAEDFAKGYSKTKTANMFIEGRTVYSYGLHFPIAMRLTDNIVLFNSDKYSKSTSRHQNLVERAVCGQGFEIREVDTKSLQEAIDQNISTFKQFVALNL